ncbi:MAG: hypothetical protein V7637_3857 [Mycobacteriales bacterium]
MPEVELPDVVLRPVVLRPASSLAPARPAPPPYPAQPSYEAEPSYRQQPGYGSADSGGASGSSDVRPVGPPSVYQPQPQPQGQAPWSPPDYAGRAPGRGFGGWAHRRVLARTSLRVRWPVLVVLVAAGWSVGWLTTVLAGPSGLYRYRWVLVVGALGGLAAAAGLGMLVLPGFAARAGRSVAGALRRAVRRVRSRGGSGGPEAGGLSVLVPTAPDWPITPAPGPTPARPAVQAPAPPPVRPTVSAPAPRVRQAVSAPALPPEWRAGPAPPPVVPVRPVRAELGERISLGTRSRRLTAESVLPDEALRGWVAEQAHLHDYDLVRIVCAFRPQAGERFVWARLVARLTGAPGDPPAVVASMLPTSEQTVASRRRVVRLGANLRLLEAGTETESSSSVSYPRLTAVGTLRSTAEWHLHSPTLLFGEREFLLVVERPAGSPVTCVFDVHARIEWGRDGGGDYTAELPPEMRQLVLS